MNAKAAKLKLHNIDRTTRRVRLVEQKIRDASPERLEKLGAEWERELQYKNALLLVWATELEGVDLQALVEESGEDAGSLVATG